MPRDGPYMNGSNENSSHQNETYSSKSAPGMQSLTNGAYGHLSDQNGKHDPQRRRVFVLSAKDPAVCLKMARNLAAFLRLSIQKGQAPTCIDLAYTLLERRSPLSWTLAISASNIEDLAEHLEQPTVKALQATKQQQIGFVFNGQGAQWYAMGRELLTAYPIFSASIDKADKAFKGYGSDWSLYGT